MYFDFKFLGENSVELVLIDLLLIFPVAVSGNNIFRQLTTKINVIFSFVTKSVIINSLAVGLTSWVQTALKSFFLKTLFLDQMHNFSFAPQIYLKEIPWHKNNFIFN